MENNNRFSSFFSGLTKMNLKPLFVANIAFMGTYALTASVVQASDLQIYVTPTAGQKTLIMMLDTSGSMDYTSASSDYNDCKYGWYSETQEYSESTVYYCTSGNNKTGNKRYGRIYRLQKGMYDFLNSSDPNLNETKVGLGRFWISNNGTYNGGYITVEAEKMGPVGSPHREKLKTAVRKLTADNNTPTAHAYAEAAAYLMGTNTIKRAMIAVDKYKTETTYELTGASCPNNYTLSSDKLTCTRWGYTNRESTNRVYGNVTRHYQCSTNSLNSIDYTAEVQKCKSNGWTTVDSIPLTYTTSDQFYDIPDGKTYYANEVKTEVDSNYSGFTKSTSGSIRDDLNYISPLPAADKRQSCDGQGVYILSDGEANQSSENSAKPLMQQALQDANFSCPATSGLTNLSGSAWHCMGELAKKLFNKENPAGVSIQTAFVGFGSDFTSLGNNHVQQACRISSRTQFDRRSSDACSPDGDTKFGTARSLLVQNPGFGNGGFFTVQETEAVTDSVIQFIKNLGDTKIEPLPTGAISVPVDALNPNGFQPYGYLRALSPNPGQPVLVWAGNLKKYDIHNGALAQGTKTVFNSLGKFDLTTSDLWNKTGVADGGLVDQGGVYWNLPMPTQAVAAVAANPTAKTRAVPEIKANVNGLRNLYTDASGVSGGKLVQPAKGNLLQIPEKNGFTLAAPNVLEKFKTQSVLKDFPVLLRYKLLNYLGYELGISTTPTALPDTLSVPTRPYISLGGSIHSFPVQLTYSGELDANGDLTTVRKQAVLYGSMEGGLHIVDAKSGIEQSVFIPAEILNDADASRALKFGEAGSGNNMVKHGVSGAWIADPAYETSRGSSDGASAVVAKRMHVYGGMRMGGKSFYGLDAMDPIRPKLLFRIGADQANFNRLGQTWSKPVVANIRHNNKIRRVLIMGGGYDTCYEYPRFKLGAANPTEFGGGCNKTVAEGNAIYIIDAETGERIWWTSNTGSNLDNTNLVHSVASRVSTLDRDGDNLVDHIYFGDLGGQIFRIDLNNKKDTPTTSFGKNVVRLANLATTETGTSITNGDAPRFYQAPTITIHDEGDETFILVAIASGDRSTPLDVAPSKGRETIKPFNPLTGRPTNKVFGLIDRDFISRDLYKDTYSLKSKDITLAKLQKDPQNLASYTAVKNVFFGGGKEGWYRSLSSDYLGNEVTSRTPGGVKAFEEEPIAIKGNLFVPVYDPEGTGVEEADPCQPRIVGESDRQQYCLPYGVCYKDGKKDIEAEKRTGMVMLNGVNQNVLGAGIRGIALGPSGGGSGGGTTDDPNSCGALTLIGNIKGAGEWKCSRILNPIRWYEKNVAPK